MLSTLNQYFNNRGVATIYLNDNKDILFTNDSASKLLKLADGFCQIGGKLVINDRSYNLELENALKRTKTSVVSEPILIPRTLGVVPYTLNLISFSDHGLMSESPLPDAIALVSAPDCKIEFPTKIMREWHSLTNAELCLAQAIFEDQSIKGYADHRGIKVSTVRWTLSNIFDKTFTSSQQSLRGLIESYANV